MASLSPGDNEIDSKVESTESKQEKQSKEEKQESSEEEFYALSFFGSHKFEIATKRISVPSDIGKFVTSATYLKLIKFLNDLSDSVKGHKISSIKRCNLSTTTLKFEYLLNCIEEWMNNIEPLQIQSRYGNKAYRILINKIETESRSLIIGLLPDLWIKEKKNKDILNGIINELSGYLLNSFGDKTRIDYGTGHELTFICFILILVELRIFRRNDYKSIVLILFNKYINLMRKIQIKYGLEPAGTKGVWGLDDYQFLTFYFGAAQLINHQNIKPKHILNKQILRKYENEYLYLSSIQFILKMKTGPFAEHSPLLNDISAVPFWYKVKNGLLKMYQDDVLKKLPVVQHFLFASILSIDLPPINKSLQNDEKTAILKRKQALIDKLNAKNPKFNTKKTQNQNNNNNNNNNNDNDNNNNNNNNNTNNNKNVSPMVMTSAPWAQQNNANNNNSNAMPSTKAPWTK